jgi:GR25 family glycosyltransferase involved in LPS biosynthesis
MKTLNEFFDHIFVLTIDRNQDRMPALLEQLDRNNIEAEIILGMDGENHPFSQISTVNPDRIFRFGEGQEGINCKEAAHAYNHKLIFINAIARGYKNFLILEDDAVFIDNFQEKFSEVVAELPEDWDIFYLGAQFWYGRPTDFSEKLGRGNKTLAAHAIGFNSRNFEFLLNNIPLNVPVDVYYLNLEDVLNVYVSKRILVDQNTGFDSSLVDERTSTDLWHWNNILDNE